MYRCDRGPYAVASEMTYSSPYHASFFEYCNDENT